MPLGWNGPLLTALANVDASGIASAQAFWLSNASPTFRDLLDAGSVGEYSE